MKVNKSRTLYIRSERGHTPEGAGKEEFLADYQKKNPPVKKVLSKATKNSNMGRYGTYINS